MKLLIITLTACFIALACAESEHAEDAESTTEYLPPMADESAPLTKDGYQYRTVRRLKYRQRREAPSTEYLPPVTKPTQDYLPPVAAETHAANNGYRYKTVRRFKVRRHRREAPSNEYLPPVAAAPTQEYLPPAGAPIQVGNDGYRYKTVRRLRFRARHRRDVSALTSLPSADYLPPVNIELAPDWKTVLGNDGYRYKTVRRLRYRRRRREAEGDDDGADVVNVADAKEDASAVTDETADKIVDLPNVINLPPSSELAEEPAMKSSELAEDGYRYKTVRRVRYRHRH